MRSVTVEMFEAEVEAFVAAAEAGEPIIICRDGKPIVKLMPPRLDEQDIETCPS